MSGVGGVAGDLGRGQRGSRLGLGCRLAIPAYGLGDGLWKVPDRKPAEQCAGLVRGQVKEFCFMHSAGVATVFPATGPMLENLGDQFRYRDIGLQGWAEVESRSQVGRRRTDDG